MALDNFIPRPSKCQCNECKKRVNFTVTCPRYPRRIPHEVLVGEDCPEFEAMEPKQETAQEPNWTELLEREFPDYRGLIEAQRASGRSDKETYELLETWG